MKASHGLTKNFIFLMASNVLSPVFSMVLVLAISHLRGAEMLGKYSLVMTIFIVGQSCAPLGLPILVTREVAKAPRLAGHYFMNACLLTGGLIALALLAIIPGIWSIQSDHEMRIATALTLLSLLPSVPMAIGEAVLLAFGRAADYVSVGLAENIARASVGALLVFAGYDVAAIAATLLGMRILASMVLAVVLRWRGVTFATRFDRALWRDFLGHIPVLGSIPIVNQIYARSDVFLLTALGTWSDVGIYSAGLRLVDLARTIPLAYSKAIYPVLARVFGQRTDEFMPVAQRSLRHGLLMMAPATILLCSCSPVVITAFYGSRFSGGETSLALLSWTLLPLMTAAVLAQVLFAAGKQAIDLRVNIISTAINVPANVLLIPRMGAAGAALAVLVSMSVYATLQYFWTRQHVGDPEAVPFLSKIVAISLASVVVAMLLLRINVIAAATIGLATYAVAGIAMGLVTRHELDGWRARIGSVGSRAFSGVR